LTQNYYPRNLTLKDFCDFNTLPTLVYELEYPRTERIDWLYVAEKTAATFGIIVVMIAVSQSWIYPVVMYTVRMKEAGMTVQQRMQEFPWVLSDLLFPFMMEYLLTFYLIWECVVSEMPPSCYYANFPSSTPSLKSPDSQTAAFTRLGGTRFRGISMRATGIARCITSCSGTSTTAPSARSSCRAYRPAW
jgi:hypothetical protein